MEHPTHYRYTDGFDERNFLLFEHKYFVIRETPCFYYVLSESAYDLWKRTEGKHCYEEPRRVSKTARVRWCYPSKEEALDSYKCRKESQLRYAQESLNKASYALEQLEGKTSVDAQPTCYQLDTVELGKPDWLKNYHFN